MAMIDYLLLLSKNDIPFVEAGVLIHQPTVKEIAFIGQENFFLGCEILNFSKKSLIIQDKTQIEQLSDFEILMAIINNENEAYIKKNKKCLQLLLLLLFPDFTINFLPASIMLSKEEQRHLIDKNNFNIFKNIINEMFCLSKVLKEGSSKYNPGGPQARALVQKFKKRQRKIAQLKNKNQEQKIEILSRYLSILSVGEQKDMNILLNYSVFQLYDEFNRFKMKEDFDIYIDCKLAGARDLEEVKNWMDDLHSQN